MIRGGTVEAYHPTAKVLSGNNKSRSSFIPFHDPVQMMPIHMIKEAKALKRWEWGVIKHVYRCHSSSRVTGLRSHSLRGKWQRGVGGSVSSVAKRSGSEFWPHHCLSAIHQMETLSVMMAFFLHIIILRIK